MKPDDTSGLGRDSASFKRLNPHLFGDKLSPVTLPQGSVTLPAGGCAKSPAPAATSMRPPAFVAPDLAPRESTDEAKLNKTERAYLAHLLMLKVPNLRVQKITLKLAWDTRLTVDFTYVDENGRLTFVDVKGFQREDALIKMRVAASQYPEFRFVIVKREKGGWETTEVNP